MKTAIQLLRTIIKRSISSPHSMSKVSGAGLFLLLSIFLTSCNDFLDRSPQGQFTEDDNPGALAEGKIFNIYTMMRNFNITAGTPAFAIHCFRSEDSEKGSISSEPFVSGLLFPFLLSGYALRGYHHFP